MNELFNNMHFYFLLTLMDYITTFMLLYFSSLELDTHRCLESPSICMT